MKFNDRLYLRDLLPYPKEIGNFSHTGLMYDMSTSFYRIACKNTILGNTLDLEYFERDPEFLKHHAYD